MPPFCLARFSLTPASPSALSATCFRPLIPCAAHAGDADGDCRVDDARHPGRDHQHRRHPRDARAWCARALHAPKETAHAALFRTPRSFPWPLGACDSAHIHSTLVCLQLHRPCVSSPRAVLPIPGTRDAQPSHAAQPPRPLLFDPAQIPRVRAGKHGYVLPPEEEPFANALKELCVPGADGQRKRLQMGLTAKKHADATFTNRCARRALSAFTCLLCVLVPARAHSAPTPTY
eukprot:5244102-Pleurochrysis_carterae.AAC.3